MARQLTFDLTVPPALTRADFLVTDANAAVLAMLDSPQAWPQGRMLLIGPAGAGKSHLAAFWAAEHGATRVNARNLHPDAAEALLPEGGALVVEDAHRAGGAAGAEQALFHLWNLAPARGALLLLTARSAPRDWGLALPDLRSRMDAVTQVRLGPPDPALLQAVLVKLFADRQIAVPPAVIGWLALRMDRDLGLARRLVAAMDAQALSDRRPLTRALAAEVLDRLAIDEA
ncbi:MAG: DnaA/Hda family protein [Paracoccus sp. (in: a-proteobacteria)]|uniref:DnaA/Hda family protein n=1 Tax=Paracoccus sp. TaxID=267 RepID=UPI0026DFE446|nr:DnaA/Hda family protein [Paracoccus sp. (in: a-proteobacteria)]MDO5622343.1 DnaA/Hda family protein [Paracoccus sp. (in: a-proteobacteria)]